MEKDYKTIKQPARAEHIEKKSRFIATVRPVTTEAQALAFINEMRKEVSDATHNTYAYVIPENNIARFSDDGEPGGTAGLPMMEVLKQEELQDVAVVVTRYFGGTLLGAGGLVRAYSKGAKIGVDAGIISVMTDCTLLKITVSYELYGRLQYLLEKENLKIEESDFGQDVTITICIRSSELSAFQKKLTETTNGRNTIEVITTEYRPIEI